MSKIFSQTQLRYKNGSAHLQKGQGKNFKDKSGGQEMAEMENE